MGRELPEGQITTSVYTPSLHKFHQTTRFLTRIKTDTLRVFRSTSNVNSQLRNIPHVYTNSPSFSERRVPP